ncbi:hypothetical protein VQH23_05670 [Pararoseomonas sp. SCSIO 73927]|uniref:hypothetical protein n=1 Tax=Pararoseomonas sp. SCSIO 73927 TaxID=3114537 RepID=UPI0030D594E2
MKEAYCTTARWLLLPALPLALLALLLPANRHRDALGLDTIDCDGPIRVLLLAVPALVLGTVALLATASRRRPAATLLLLATLAAASVAAARAAAEDRRQATACANDEGEPFSAAAGG